MGVDITTRPQLRIAAVRHVGPYAKIGQAFGKLDAIVGKAGLVAPDGMLVGVYHDDPATTPEEKLASDAGVTISDTAKVPAGLTEERVPAGRYAHARHNGPYAGLPAAWGRLRTAIANDGLKRGAGASYEVYPNTPMNAKPEELITDIYIPIA